ncbi:MAG: TonB-dependent receptor plug domain-containing protein, partial [Bacteroidota bacterium]
MPEPSFVQIITHTNEFKDMKYYGIFHAPHTGNSNQCKRILKLLLTAMRIFTITIFVICFTTFMLSAKDSRGQHIEDVYISLTVKNASLEKVIRKIEKQSPFRFVMDAALAKSISDISYDEKAKSVKEILNIILVPYHLNFEQDGKNIIVSRPQEPNNGIAISGDNENSAIEKKPIKGKVVNEKDEPLAGVTVQEKSTSNAVTTDDRGNFSIMVNDNNAVLVFTYIGMSPFEMSPGTQQSLSVQLKAEQSTLGDVVVVGYGTQKRKDITGSVSTVNADAYKDQPVLNVSSALQGRVAGVSVTNSSGAPGGQVRIRIRGANSITASNEPLYVVDGIALGSLGLQDININDIQSMEILKDASATAIYGSRGANGVVLITTKS